MWYPRITAYCRVTNLPFMSRKLRKDEPVFNFALDYFLRDQISDVCLWYAERDLSFHDVATDVLAGMFLHNSASKLLTCQVNALRAVHIVAIAMYGLFHQVLRDEDMKNEKDPIIRAALGIIVHRVPKKIYELNNDIKACHEEVVITVNAGTKGVEKTQFTKMCTERHHRMNRGRSE